MFRNEKTKARILTAVITTAALIAGITLSGCSAQNEEKLPSEVGQTEQQNSSPETDQNEQKPVNDKEGSGIVETSLNLVGQDKTLKLDFSLKNTSGQDLDLLFGSGHQYDIIVTDADGQEVYNWAADMDFTMALINKSLAPGEELSYSEEWNYTDTEGKPLSAGKYSVKVTFRASVENEDLKDKVKAEDFTAVKEMEIK